MTNKDYDPFGDRISVVQEPPMTDEVAVREPRTELAEIRERHHIDNADMSGDLDRAAEPGCLEDGQRWPCDASVLLGLLDEAAAGVGLDVEWWRRLDGILSDAANMAYDGQYFALHNDCERFRLEIAARLASGTDR
jgi:hypothetical protein